MGKRMNEGRLERALEKENTFFFPGPKSLSASAVTIACSGSRWSGDKWHFQVEIISLDIQEPQDSRRGPIVRSATGASSTPSMQRPLLFMLLPLCPCFCQLIQHGGECSRRGCGGETSRGCSRTSYPMHFQLTSNGTRSFPQGLY